MFAGVYKSLCRKYGVAEAIAADLDDLQGYESDDSLTSEDLQTGSFEDGALGILRRA